MTEHEKFEEVFQHILNNPCKYEIQSTAAGKLIVSQNNVISITNSKRTLSIRGLPDSQPIDIPQTLWSMLDAAIETIRITGKGKTRNLKSFLHGE